MLSAHSDENGHRFRRESGDFSSGFDLSHGGSVELQSVGIVDDAIEDGVGEGGFADDLTYPLPLGRSSQACAAHPLLRRSGF
jgi:hypothetical protein